MARTRTWGYCSSDEKLLWLAFLLSVCKTCISYSRAGWVVSFILIFHTLCPAHMIIQYTCFVDGTPFDFNKKCYVTKPHTCIQNRLLYMLNREKSRLNNAKQTHFGKLKYWQFKRICFIIYKISEKITLKNLKTTFKKKTLFQMEYRLRPILPTLQSTKWRFSVVIVWIIYQIRI